MSLSAKRFSEIGIFCYACCISVFGFVVSHFFPLGNSKKITTRVQSWPKMANTNFVSRLLNWKNSQTDQKKHGLVNEISDTAPRKVLTIGLWTLVRMVIHCGETGVRISHSAMDDRMKSCISFACALKGLVNRQWNRCWSCYIKKIIRLRTQPGTSCCACQIPSVKHPLRHLCKLAGLDVRTVWPRPISGERLVVTARKGDFFLFKGGVSI